MMKKAFLILALSGIAGLLLFYSTPAPLDAQDDLSSNDDGDFRSLDAEKIVVLHAEINGMIRKITARPQEFVAQDDPIIEFDRELVDLQLERITTQIERDTGVEEARINLDFSQDALNIVQQNYDTIIGGARVASPKELKEAQQRYAVANLGDKKAGRDLALLDNDKRQSEMIRKRHTIRAPMNGVIVPLDSIVEYRDQPVKQPEVGEMIPAGSVVAAMMKVDRLHVSTTLSTDRLSQVYLGQKADVYVRGFGNKPFPGKIIYISPTLNFMEDVSIKVELENPEIDWKKLPRGAYRHKFRPGMGARVEIVFE
jgi:multidrug resistance efflux pump